MKSFFKKVFGSSRGAAETVSLDTDIDSTEPMTNLLTAQSAGEPVRKTGYFEKRGGQRSRAYKRRWIVLTELGNIFYFNDSQSSASLGHLNLFKAEIIFFEGADEVIVKTGSRNWDFRFSSAQDTGEWVKCFREVIRKIDQWEKDGTRRRSCIPSQQLSNDLLRRTTSISADYCPPKALDNSPPISNSPSEILISCVTWNLSEELPEMERITFLRDLRKAHVVAVAVQESQPVMYRNRDSTKLAPVDVWQTMVKATLGQRFSIIASKVMGAIHLCVFGRIDIMEFVTDVSTGMVPCGIGNVMHNKGAVGVAFTMNEKSICFVSSHLAANRHRVLIRNNDFSRIDSHMPGALGKAFETSNERDIDSNCAFSIAPSQSVYSIDPLKPQNAVDDVKMISVAAGVGGEPSADGDAIIPEVADKKTMRTKKRASIIDSIMGITPLEEGDKSKSLLAKRFDRCFFMGDLNYRLEEEIKSIKEMLYMALLMKKLECPAEINTSVEINLGDINLSSNPDLSLSVQQRVPFSGTSNVVAEKLAPPILAQASVSHTVDTNTADTNSFDNIKSAQRKLSIQDNMEANELRMQLMQEMNRQSLAQGERDSDDRLDIDDDEDDEEGQRRGLPAEAESSADSVNVSSSRSIVDLSEKVMSETIEELTDEQRLEKFKAKTGLKSYMDVLNYLLSLDQLNMHRAEGKVLLGFEEPPIVFKPSYKFDPYTDIYDTGKKDRGAAWCDRVLYNKQRDEVNIVVLDYRCVHGIFHSDHRAVIAEFKVQL